MAARSSAVTGSGMPAPSGTRGRSGISAHTLGGGLLGATVTGGGFPHNVAQLASANDAAQTTRARGTCRDSLNGSAPTDRQRHARGTRGLQSFVTRRACRSLTGSCGLAGGHGEAGGVAFGGSYAQVALQTGCVALQRRQGQSSRRECPDPPVPEGEG